MVDMSMRSTVYVFVGSFVASLVAMTPSAEASCIPGFDFAAFGDNQVDMGGGAITDSYDSSLGTFTQTQIAGGGDVCTNSTNSGAVDFNGAGTQVYGNVCVGTGGSTSTGISPNPGPYLSSSVLAAPVVLTPVVVPVVGTNQGNVTCNSACTIAPEQTYGDVIIKDVATLNAGTYVMESLTVTAGGSLNVGTGPIMIYITGPDPSAVLDIGGNSVTNPSLKATDLTFMVATTSTCKVKVTGGASAAYAVYAPGCEIDVAGNGTIYGAIVGKDIKITGGASVHYDAALKNHGFGAFECIVTEVSRSTPIIATISNFQVIVQGTYEYPLRSRQRLTGTANLASFRFPYTQGHLRASKLAQFGTTAIDFTGRTGSNEVFDAATLLPAADMTASCVPFTSTCRTVFTSAVTGIDPVVFSNANASAIGALITAGLTDVFSAAEHATVVSRIVAGNEVTTNNFQPKLGGMDRSSVAVIPRSLTAGTTRPTMIYVGGTDGMLHAFCASVSVGTCDVVGRELWAFVPRVQLQQLRENLAIIDGSPRVIDAFGDFDGNAGTPKTFATILMFTTGTGDRTVDRTPAVYGIDITNPATPKIIWEHTMDVASADAFKLGHGQMITAGPVLIAGVQKNVAFVQTNNGAALKDSAGTLGTGVAGSMVTALDMETGVPVWTHTYAYPAPRVSTNGAVPMQAIPGGAVAVDLDNSGTLSDIVFGTIYGDLWVLDATTGLSRYSNTVPAESPLFQLQDDFEPIGAPPAIFSDNSTLYAVATTGAYWDRSSAGQWNNSPLQWIFAAKLKTLTAPPLDETMAQNADVPFAISFSGTEKSSTQALVVGGEIVFLTDIGDINDAAYGTGSASGAAHKISLSGASTGDDTVVVAGAGSVAASGTTLFASSGKGTEELSFGAAGTTGETVNASLAPKVSRRLWLRTL
jgi:hypothetical protein